jgi:hypothetical protein
MTAGSNQGPVTIRRVQQSADWRHKVSPDGTLRGLKPGRGYTLWVVVRDGRRIDSFLDRANASRKAARLNRQRGGK